MHTVKEQVEYLREFVTDYKNDLFRRLIAERTSYVTMVLEDFFQHLDRLHRVILSLPVPMNRQPIGSSHRNFGIIRESDIDLHRGKMAFFMGTELTGLSDDVLSRADEFVKVPMYGFTES